MKTTFVAIMMTLALSTVQESAKAQLWEAQTGTSGGQAHIEMRAALEAGRG